MLLLDQMRPCAHETQAKCAMPNTRSVNRITAGDGSDLVSRSACCSVVGTNLKRMFCDETSRCRARSGT